MNAMQVIVCLSLFALMMPVASAKAQSGTYFYVDDYFKEKFAGEAAGDATPSAPALESGVMAYTDSDAFHAKFGELPQETTVNELVISPGDTLKAEDLAAAAGAPSAGETAAGKETKPIEVVVIPLKDEPVNGTLEGELVIAPEVIAPEVVIAPLAEAPTEEAEEAEDLVVQKLETPPLVVKEDITPTGAVVAAGNTTESGSQKGGDGVPLQIIIIGALVVVIVIMLVILLARKEPKKGAKQEKKGGKEVKAKASGADWQEGDFLKTTVKAIKNDSKAVEKPAEKPVEKKPAEPKQETKEVKPFLLKIRDES